MLILRIHVVRGFPQKLDLVLSDLPVSGAGYVARRLSQPRRCVLVAPARSGTAAADGSMSEAGVTTGTAEASEASSPAPGQSPSSSTDRWKYSSRTTRVSGCGYGRALVSLSHFDICRTVKVGRFETRPSAASRSARALSSPTAFSWVRLRLSRSALIGLRLTGHPLADWCQLTVAVIQRAV
ncbi:hypothetical protein ABT112_06900 [Streptomyces sp. NPDC002055]|uniref:hypothetical protein n=1 Tax=Streptomyces sp. NPDC002055 TaxID=3154534 RepID=UPI003324CF39